VKYKGVFMNLLAWIVIGGIAGWIATLITKTGREYGFLSEIIIGIIGAVIGGFLFNLVGGPGIFGLNFTSMVIAIIGAVILIWVAQAVRGGYTR